MSYKYNISFMDKPPHVVMRIIFEERLGSVVLDELLKQAIRSSLLISKLDDLLSSPALQHAVSL